MAATNFCNDHISQNSFLSRFKPDYFVTGRINQNNAVNTLYIELIDAKNLFLIASNHLPVDELHNTSQFIIDNIWICPYISRHLLSLNPLQARCRRYSRGER